MSPVTWWLALPGVIPGRKKHSLLRDKYFHEYSRILYLCWKSLNMSSEWENIKECNKCPRTILNIRSGQLMVNPLIHLEFGSSLPETELLSLHSGWSLAWDHFPGDITDPCCVIANFCGVIADSSSVVAIP